MLVNRADRGRADSQARYFGDETAKSEVWDPGARCWSLSSNAKAPQFRIGCERAVRSDRTVGSGWSGLTGLLVRPVTSGSAWSH
jgi:hypothetical protein